MTAFSYRRRKGALTATADGADAAEGLFGCEGSRGDRGASVGKISVCVEPGGREQHRALIRSIRSKGTLKAAGVCSTKGRTPRNFAIDPTGAFLLAANEESGNIVVFRIDAATGALTPTGQVEEVSAPVCITFVPAE